MTDENEIIYARNYAMMNQYAAAAGLAALGFPRQEVDVAAPVYVSLNEERRFERASQPLAGFIAELQEVAAQAPEGAEVFIEIDSERDYDEEVTTCDIGYWRDPTPEERAEREANNIQVREHNRRLAEQEAAKEREEFERLKAKYQP